MGTRFWHGSGAVALLQICERQLFAKPLWVLSVMMGMRDLVLFCQLVLKRSRVLASVDGDGSVANL